MPLPSSKKVFTYKHRGWIFPTLGFALRLHDQLLEVSGGLPGVKDEGSLISALNAPITSAGNEDAYHTFFDKVAALGYLVARNHAFSDGNKRTSLGLIMYTLNLNKRHPTWSEETQTMVISLLGAGYLSREGLKHALILGCGLDLTDNSL